ncbi:MAG: thiamine pyrophosphate-dependent dehydrogenase E1 component subunit alpha [Actinomycetia bacterium]|nr:thiamine pyrophosphate-dependent dehydrogenase E1 component subunit alpha [Actinomycetes bacterium]
MAVSKSATIRPTGPQLVRLYTNMVRVRRLDEFLVDAYYSGRLAGPFFHSQQGQEAIGAGACTFLRPDDYVWYTHRGHGVCEAICKGLPMRAFVAEHFGKATGSCNGIGFINTCAPELGMFGMGGTVGGESTLAAGTALAAQFRGKGQAVLCFLGDGAMGEGSVHTALLMSANWNLPVVWLCSNNGMSMWVPVEAAYPKENVADLAFGYDIPSTIEDGQDVAAVYSAVHTAVERARSGQGPSFIEFKTCRYRPQVEGVADYCLDGLRDPVEVKRWKQRDPIDLCARRLLEEKILTREDLDRIDEEALAEVQDAERFAAESPLPDPSLLDTALYAS